MKSLDYLQLALERGFKTDEDCSTVLWIKKLSEKSHEEFMQITRESNFSTSEMLFFVSKLTDVVPEDIINKWIRRLAADPDNAKVLCLLALRWKDQRKQVFFDEFVKTFAEDSHYHLANIMFSSGALNEN